MNSLQQFVKSSFSLGIALSLFPLKQIDNLLSPTERGRPVGPATKAMDSLCDAAVEQFGGTLRGTFSALDNLQRGIVSGGFALLWPDEVRGWGRGQNRSKVETIRRESLRSEDRMTPDELYEPNPEPLSHSQLRGDGPYNEPVAISELNRWRS